MAPYLTQLCDSLKSSMIGEDHATTLKVTSDAGTVTSREAVSLGLIVTELILNALKHAFPDDRTDRQIAVGFEVQERIGSFRLRTTGSARRSAYLRNPNPVSAPASSTRSPNSSMPRLTL